ncbi:RDD family protein [Emticicia aquatilis]|nr:RDD family protein [Emticicia aquatilis]
MPSIDDLKIAYSKLSNSRLSSLLSEIDSISPEAQQVLKDEVEKRNLSNTNSTPITASELPKFIAESLQTASLGKRFLNFLIDYLAFTIFLIIFFVLGGDIVGLVDNSIFTFLYFVLIFGFPFVNYIYLEGKYGKSIGKFVTKTSVVKFDGTKISFKDSFIRTLCRFIPIDFIFAFMDDTLTLHDKISKTYVKNDIENQ